MNFWHAAEFMRGSTKCNSAIPSPPPGQPFRQRQLLAWISSLWPNSRSGERMSGTKAQPISSVASRKLSGERPNPDDGSPHRLRTGRECEHGYSLRISVRSVNHRFLDLHLRVPEGFEPVEPRIRQMIREHVWRGHVDVNLYYDLAGPAAVAVNQDVAAAYLVSHLILCAMFSSGKAEVDFASLLRLPGVIGTAGAAAGAETAQIESVVVATLKDALEKLDRMREHEADLLREGDVSCGWRISRGLTNLVAVLATRASARIRVKRLELRLKDLLGEAQLDPARLQKYSAFAAAE